MRKGLIATAVAVLSCGPAAAADLIIDFDVNGQPSDYGCNVIDACIIPYSPAPFLQTAVVNVGGEHGNVLQATAGEGLNGDVFAGSPVPSSSLYYVLSSVDIFVTGPGPLYLAQDPIDAPFGEWTTLTVEPGSSVVPYDFSLRSASPWTATGTVLFDNFQFEIATRPTPPDSPESLPELATWTMMLLGFGAIGTAVRRKSRSSPPTCVESDLHSRGVAIRHSRIGGTRHSGDGTVESA